jgi:hypothetical protein
MKTICAMLLAGAFLISRPVMADDAPAKTEKPAKAKKADKKKADDKAADPAPAAGDKKADKGGW